MDAAYTGTKIAERRKELGLTQKALAERLHVTDKAVSKWERGVNFPDLGTLESLAQALQTTPASLLGLENAARDEIVSSMAEVSQEQLEDARRDHSITAWGCILLALALLLDEQLFGSKDIVSKQRAYQLLYCVITVLAIYGLHLLFKYEQIRKFHFGDYCILYSAALAELVRLGYMFISGYGPPDWLTWLCFTVSFSCLQLLFSRIMKPCLVKLLPLLLTALFALWNIIKGSLIFSELLPALCCAAVWLALLLKRKDTAV